MATITFNRPKPANPPATPRGDLLLEPPPEIPPPASGKAFTKLLQMLPMVAGAVAMGLMMMGAGPGCCVEIVAEGPQAHEALDTLVQLIADRFDEER